MKTTKPTRKPSTHEPIPADYAVQPLAPDAQAEDRATCNHCGLSWDDGICTSMTPAPAGRCPFEHFHVYQPKKKCDHRISYGTISEADGAYDHMDGSTVVDVSCFRCGQSGSVRLMPKDINWTE